jgi:hypothetical protein
MPKRIDPSKLNDDELLKAFKRLDELSQSAVRRRVELEELKARTKALRNVHGHSTVIRKGNEFQLLIWTALTYYVVAAIGERSTTPPVATPPRIVEMIFWLLLPRKVRGAIMGDAAEAFAETVKRYGPGWATLDYCKEALCAVLASTRLSLARGISLLFGRSS